MVHLIPTPMIEYLGRFLLDDSLETALQRAPRRDAPCPRTVYFVEGRDCYMLGMVLDSLKLMQMGLVEAVWPSRCVICDTPGELVCSRCSLLLPYLDQLLACPVCGAPWGRSICCECNAQTLRFKGLSHFPLDGCASALMLSAESKRIVTTFKDRGEQHLSEVIAQYLANVLPPAWMPDTVLVPIPARKNAVRQRGFDHVALIASELSRTTGIPLSNALRALPRRDQRNLDARGRLVNMAGSFAAQEEINARHIILVDDVFTTGATLFTAAETLRPLGAEKIYALTLIRA